MDTVKIEDGITPLRCPSLPVEVWNMIGEHVRGRPKAPRTNAQFRLSRLNNTTEQW
jgi:hypothetical protein